MLPLLLYSGRPTGGGGGSCSSFQRELATLILRGCVFPESWSWNLAFPGTLWVVTLVMEGILSGQ